MLELTEKMIQMALNNDNTVPEESKRNVWKALKGERLYDENELVLKLAELADSLNMPAKAGEPWIMTRRELAVAFRVSTRTISNWCRKGRLSPVKDARGQTIGYTRESAIRIYRGFAPTVARREEIKCPKTENMV